jgi:hypothetical protein
MNTKHKVIWVVIGVFASILVLMVLLGKQSPKTIEKYEDDDDDAFTEEPTTPKTKDTKDAKDAKEVKDGKEGNINYVKETMNYIKSLELPFRHEKAAFENLFNDKNTKVLEKFTSIQDLQEYVSDMVDDVTGKKKVEKVEKAEKAEKAEAQRESFEQEMATFDTVKKNLTKLDEAIGELKGAFATYTKSTMTASTTPLSTKPNPIVNERFQPSRNHPVTEEDTKNDKGDVIEGFENVRYAFASY